MKPSSGVNPPMPSITISPFSRELTRSRGSDFARTLEKPLDTKTTTCYTWRVRCGTRVHLRAGEIRYIDGNPAHPLNKGVMCFFRFR